MKKFEISEKVYNEILNSKIVIFVLLGYIDSKGNVCNKKLIDLLPTYKRKELTEEDTVHEKNSPVYWQ